MCTIEYFSNIHITKIAVTCFLLTISRTCYADSCNNASETVQRLAGYIKEGLDSAARYDLPTNATMYEATGDKITDYGSFDFVVIGGGTTGSVVASRLSENEKFTVLVLEAGKWANYNFLQFVAYLYPSTQTEYNWGLKSVPQTGACLGMVGDRCAAHTGKGFGGTTLINGGIYSQADPTVFKKWVELTKDSSWSHQNTLRLLKKSQRFDHRNLWSYIDENYHGYQGPLNVEDHLPPDQLTAIFLEANRKLGYIVSDSNGPTTKVASVYQMYTKNGRRQDVSAAFLKPVLDRNNLNVLPESYVTNIEIDESTKVAGGVHFTRRGKKYFVKAKKEVILSAGVFRSPQILMLSGVGPKEHLQKLGMKVIRDLSGVGSALTDEVINQSLLFSSKIYLPAQTQNEQIEDFLHGFGPLAGAASSQGTAWYKTDINKDTEYNDIHLYCGTTTHTQLEVKVTNWKNESYYSAWGNTTNAILMTLIFTNPRSRGTVRLQSSSPFDYPLIDFKHLSDPGNKDIAVMYEGIKLAFRLMETAPFQKLSVKYEGGPVPGCRNLTFRSKEYWHCFLRYTSSSGYHTTGTCPMGSDTQKGAVVDNNLKVFGISKLRVADGSVIPTTTAGPPSATCIMIGEKLAEVLKAQYS